MSNHTHHNWLWHHAAAEAHNVTVLRSHKGWCGTILTWGLKVRLAVASRRNCSTPMWHLNAAINAGVTPSLGLKICLDITQQLKDTNVALLRSDVGWCATLLLNTL